MFLFRGLTFRLAVPLLLAAVVGGATWWFFIREDNEAQKDAAAVTDEVRQAASATAAATTGDDPRTVTSNGASTFRDASYRIVEGQSEAWYLAPEKLANLPTSSVARGATKEVAGEFHVTESGLSPDRQTTFTVGLTTLRSDQSRRDNRVHGALNTSTYPEATFTATELRGLPAELSATEDSVMELVGLLDLHGVQREVTWELKAKQDGDIISVLATTTFNYSDFDITKPEIAGFVTVEDEVTLQVQIFAARA
ncbi:MAG: YceI family protein [Dehalococcoidia bacterium]|nr:YceI family protein [Dehalococcoidia bacterium]